MPKITDALLTTIANSTPEDWPHEQPYLKDDDGVVVTVTAELAQHLAIALREARWAIDELVNADHALAKARSARTREAAEIRRAAAINALAALRFRDLSS